MINIIWSLAVLLFVIWLVSLLLHVTAGAIHILLVIAIILVIFNLITGRRTA